MRQLMADYSKQEERVMVIVADLDQQIKQKAEKVCVCVCVHVLSIDLLQDLCKTLQIF